MWDVGEDSDFVGCDDVTLAKWFLKHYGALIFKKKFLLEVFDPEDEGTTFVRNIWNLSAKSKVSCHRRCESSPYTQHNSFGMLIPCCLINFETIKIRKKYFMDKMH